MLVALNAVFQVLLWPRGFGIAWAGYAVTTFIAFLGPGLKLAQRVLDLAPTTHVGNPRWGRPMPATWPR